jgi:hypothetical protein
MTTSNVRFHFPALEEVDDELWWPNTHGAPDAGCRCMLVAKGDEFDPDDIALILSPARDSFDVSYIDPRYLLDLPAHEKQVVMHDDFIRIRLAFIKVALRDNLKSGTGSANFWKWVRKNRFNTLAPYGEIRQAFPEPSKTSALGAHHKSVSV